MINYIRVVLLYFFLFPSCLAQLDRTEVIAEFVFQDMDQVILTFWLCEDCEISEIQSLLVNISEKWEGTREDIIDLKINHFNSVSFVEDQDIRILGIYQFMSASQFLNARREAYMLLTEFKDVRDCFTDDVYELDYLIEAYDGYRSVHEIIHDEMLGLYEWSEFVWFVDKLKSKVERLEGQLVKSQLDTKDESLFTAIEKLKGCLKTLDDSLGNAYRPDFEMPCSELNESFIELWRAYNQLITLS